MSQTKSIEELQSLIHDEGVYSRQGEILYQMHEISRLVTTWFDAAMARHNITHPQWWAMMHIVRHEGLSQSDLARLMQMGRASTGKLLERLEARSWIERRSDPEDERLRRIYIREEAHGLMNQMHAAGVEQFGLFMRDVPEALQHTLLQGIRQIRDNAVNGLAEGRRLGGTV